MFRASLSRPEERRKSWIGRPLPRVQPKLARGSATGWAEHAADNMASQVMAGRAVTSAPGLSGSEPGMSLSPEVAQSLQASKGGGAPLAESVRSQLEPRFGFNFADVRIHSNEPAYAMNKELGARAFTHGSDIYLSPQVRPDVNPVMAHELAHVTQQTGMIQCLPAAVPEEKIKRVPLDSKLKPVLRLWAKGTQIYYHNKEDKNLRNNIPVATLYDEEGNRPIGTHGLTGRIDGSPYWDLGEQGRIVGVGAQKMVHTPAEVLANKDNVPGGGPKPAPSVMTPEGTLPNYVDLESKPHAPWVQMPVSPPAATALKGISVVRRVHLVEGFDPGAIKNGGNGLTDNEADYSCIYEFFKV